MSGKLVASVAAVMVWGLTAPTIAANRAESVKILESMLTRENPSSLKVWLNNAEKAESVQITLGESQRFHFRSSTEVYLTAIHVDSQGVATLLYPTAPTKEGLLHADEEKEFPGSDEIATAIPPVGHEDLFVFGTRGPLSLTDLELPEEDNYAVFDEEAVLPFVHRLQDILKKRPPDSITTARLKMVVLGRKRTRYLATEIVAYFTTPRARSLSRVRLDLPVALVRKGNRPRKRTTKDLDRFAEAMGDTKLAGESFLVLGPRPEAESVVTYLTKMGKIDSARLTIEVTEPKYECQPEEPRKPCVEFQLDRTESLPTATTRAP